MSPRSAELESVLGRLKAASAVSEALSIAQAREQMRVIFPPECAANVTKTPWRERNDGSLVLTPTPTAPGSSVVFYVHGGGWRIGSPEVASTPASMIARLSGWRVFVPSYPLAPENPYPAALDHLASVWRELASLDGVTEIAVFGESAGGNLALALLHRLSRDELAQVPSVVLSSPVLDLTFETESIQSNANADEVMTPVGLVSIRQDYAAGHDYRDPAVSPLFSDLDGFPPMMVLCGAEEILVDDSLNLAKRAAASSVSVELHIQSRLPHCWPIYGHRVPEAVTGLTQISDFFVRTSHGLSKRAR